MTMFFFLKEAPFRNKDVAKACYIRYYLVGGLEHFLFSIIYGIVLPIDFHIFQDG